MQTLRAALLCLLLTGLGGFILVLCVQGALTDQAPRLLRHMHGEAFWIARAEHPWVFWMSLAFHGAIGSLMVLMGLGLAWHRLRGKYRS